MFHLGLWKNQLFMNTSHLLRKGHLDLGFVLEQNHLKQHTPHIAKLLWTLTCILSFLIGSHCSGDLVAKIISKSGMDSGIWSWSLRSAVVWFRSIKGGKLENCINSVLLSHLYCLQFYGTIYITWYANADHQAW